MVILPTLVGLLGAMVGSFLTVVVYRVPAGLSIVSSPSACPICTRPVRLHDQVPVVSWLVLRGRCRDCRAPISARYPLIELATALTFAGLTVIATPSIVDATRAAEAIAGILVLVALAYFAALSIALAAIDLESHRLPNSIVLPAYVFAGALFLAAALVGKDLESAVRAGAGAGLLFALYLTLALVSPRGMGMGDVKLAGVIGLYLGWTGWASAAVGTLAAFFLGGVVSIILVIAQKARRTTAVPFGPCMLAGAWTGILLGEPIERGYLALFGLASGG